MSGNGWRTWIALCLLAIAAPVSAADGLRWQNDLETAKRLAGESNRLVLVHFGATWCPPCQRLERYVFSQAGFGKELDPHFVAVKLDYDQHQALAARLGVKEIPADVVLSPDGQIVRALQSPPSATQYIAGLSQIVASRTTAPAAVAQNQPTLPPPPQAIAETRPVAPPTTMTAPPPATNAAMSSTNDRYNDYYRSREPAAPSTVPASSLPASTAAVPTAPTTPIAATTAPPAVTPPQLPAGSPALALDGCCPVTLIDGAAWALGDIRWGAIHRGRTYLFTSAEAQQRFLANPDFYSPVMSGNDPVLALDQRQLVPGTREFGVFVDRRIYLFSSDATRRQFEANPGRYTAEITQAMR